MWLSIGCQVNKVVSGDSGKRGEDMYPYTQQQHKKFRIPVVVEYNEININCHIYIIVNGGHTFFLIIC